MMAIFDLLIALFVIWGIFSIRSYLKKLISQREEASDANSIYEVSSDDILLIYADTDMKSFHEIAQGIRDKLNCTVIKVPEKFKANIIKNTSDLNTSAELKSPIPTPSGGKDIREAPDTIKINRDKDET